MRRIFFGPALLWGLTLFGQASALMGEGVWDMLSWVALGLPVAVVLRYWNFGGRPRFRMTTGPGGTGTARPPRRRPGR